MKTGDSLSGQNKGRRAAGTGSSPVHPTRSERTRLWKRLRYLDRECAKCKELIDWYNIVIQKERYIKQTEKFKNLDARRKEVRLKLKGYWEAGSRA